VALGLFIVYVFELAHGITKRTGVPIDYSFFEELKGNFKAYLFTLVMVWTGAGFGE
jgi:hypothetical protein